MAHCGQRVRFAATWREEFFEVPIYETVDAIRNFGNFSAHPINDITSLQVIDVQPQEAEWCLEILEALFEHFYVGPAAAAAKKKALDAKLKGAGKPPSK